ncbi:uncharacterized protein FOMMEDRAFT_164445 [Fomitiporia mediterranea MF3/22]|uniref:uncharacterized protein n=1 Tax=Fomitiporia mediterranea (strain MF3/22) TaxID=694068 RepID=UPI000440803B|nr:uncharacterized protein FOMMEDRAFT_164445 [Fomitiporia mediterranea MF3/22]EJD07485.1 hypothetical protein FOMMEDRAFT_164445 [Fomitiporia mediterranea MF3/22]
MSNDFRRANPNDSESEQEDLARRVQEQQHRPASIDMALNLERELDAEHDHHQEQDGYNDDGGDGVYDRQLDGRRRLRVRETTSGSSYSASAGEEADIEEVPLNDSSAGSVSAAQANKRVSLDPQILQQLVANLRIELARTIQERDALAETLANAPTREAELREALSLLTDRCAKLESELEGLRKKSQDDEDQVNMLRTKLEESRSALMRLQTENKRASIIGSHMSVDTSRANTLFGGGPSSSKRASFTPLTGSGATNQPQTHRMHNHRRISSVSEPSFALESGGTEPGSPVGRTISWPEENGNGDANAKKGRRSSAFYGGIPMSMGSNKSASTSPSPPTHSRQLAVDNNTNEELDALRKERDSARAELISAKQELAEAQEAREASEQCVSALRTFIAAQAASEDSGVSTTGILKLPPLPTERSADEEQQRQQTPSRKNTMTARPGMGAGWSFGKLFRTESGSTGESSSTNVSPPVNGSSATSPASGAPSISTNSSTSNGSGNGGNNSPSPSTATPGGAFSRTFGGFFGGRAPSITSITSVTSPSKSPASDSTGKANKDKKLPVRPPTAHGQQEPTMNGLGSDDEDEGEGDETYTRSPPQPHSPPVGEKESQPAEAEPRSPSVEGNDRSKLSEVSEIWVRNKSDTSTESQSEVRDLDAGVDGKGKEETSVHAAA